MASYPVSVGFIGTHRVLQILNATENSALNISDGIVYQID